MRVLTLSLALAALLAPPLFGADDAARVPVPESGALIKSEKLIKDIFKDDYTAAKKKPDAALELAAKMLKQAQDTKDDPAAKYVLLRESRDLAAGAGDGAQALAAVDQMSVEFAVNAVELKAAALETAAKSTNPQADWKNTLDAALSAEDDALTADDFPAASKINKAAVVAAQKSQNKVAATALQDRGKQIDAAAKEFDALKDAFATLKDKPDDADACFKVGRFYGALKGDWDRGLPYLAKGGDEKWKALARRDLENPGKADAQAGVGDDWWDLADAEAGVAKDQLRLRAAYWYKQAAPTLTGISQSKVEKRMKDLDKLLERQAALNVKETPPDDWVVLFRSFDPRLWDKDVKLGKNNFGLPLEKAPDDTKFLRLTLVGTKDYVIIPLTKAQLNKRAENGKVGWMGENFYDWHGCHLGVYDLDGKDMQKGLVCVSAHDFKDRLGWGFGHRWGKDDVQGYSWGGVPLPLTVFEIAVKPTDLTDEEAKHLLAPPKKEK
jgi:hypothetical protein